MDGRGGWKVGKRMASQWWRFRCTIRQIERGKVTRGSVTSERERSSEGARGRESKERSEGESIEKAGWLNSITKVTSSQLSSLLLRAFYPLPPLYFDSPYSPYLVFLPFSLHFYYDEPSSPLFRASSVLSSRGSPTRAPLPSPDFPVSPAWHRFNMQEANSRQYKREMASFEVRSENASTMAGSVLRDERARSGRWQGWRGDRHWGRTEWLAWFRKAEKKRSLSRTKWRWQFRVSRNFFYFWRI